MSQDTPCSLFWGLFRCVKTKSLDLWDRRDKSRPSIPPPVTETHRNKAWHTSKQTPCFDKFTNQNSPRNRPHSWNQQLWSGFLWKVDWHKLMKKYFCAVGWLLVGNIPQLRSHSLKSRCAKLSLWGNWVQYKLMRCVPGNSQNVIFKTQLLPGG